MTIPVQIPFNQSVASGITDTFAFTFRILADEDQNVSVEVIVQVLDFYLSIKTISFLVLFSYFKSE